MGGRVVSPAGLTLRSCLSARPGAAVEYYGDPCGHRAPDRVGLRFALRVRALLRRADRALYPEHSRGERRLQHGEANRLYVLHPEPEFFQQGRADRVPSERL